MEESSWSGWTTRPTPQAPSLGYPEGRKLPGGPPAGWVGELRSITEATDETVKLARRTWPQLRPDDLERTGKRRFIHRPTGEAYDLCHGSREAPSSLVDSSRSPVAPSLAPRQRETARLQG